VLGQDKKQIDSIYEKNQIMPYADLIREEMLNLQVHNDNFIHIFKVSLTFLFST